MSGSPCLKTTPTSSSCKKALLWRLHGPVPLHQQAAYRLARQLDEQLPAGWDFLLDVEVVVRAEHPPIVRVPDLVVTKIGAADRRLIASDVLLAVEIISPGSRNVDLHLVPFDLRIDISALVASHS